MTKPIWQWSAVQTAQAIQAKEVSCQEVVQSHVERMRAVNPHLNAITVDLSEAALTEAKRADHKIRVGQNEGELFGVPVTIKENVDVKGQATPNGIPALSNLIAPADSPVVHNLKKAGAIIIGRTNTPEFSFRAFTDNPLRGLTKNPWDEKISCGGSSGGAGASIAAGIGSIAHGNDIGGSLRFPAYQNGVSTIRPTLGRVPAYNPSAAEERPPLMTLMSVQGPIARSIADVRLGLKVMSARDPHDPWWVPAPLEGEKVDPLRVAVTTNGHGYAVHSATKEAITRAADLLSNAGCVVEEREPPDLAEVFQHWSNMIFTEMKYMMDEVVRELSSAKMLQVIEGYYNMSEIQDYAGYMRGLAKRNTMLREWNLFLEEFPVLLTPATLEPPFLVDADLKGDEAVRDIFRASIYISTMNLLGLPAAITPVTFHEGLPIGVQLISRRYREDLCLSAAEIIEQAIGMPVAQLWARE